MNSPKLKSSSPASLPSPSPLLIPPPLPLPSYDDDLLITLTDDWGMIVAEDGAPASAPSQVRAVKEKRPRKPRRRITYVSRHFTNSDEGVSKHTSSTDSSVPRNTVQELPVTPATPPNIPAKIQKKTKSESKRKAETTADPQPQIHHGLSLEDLSSDSSLTSLPSSIGPSPFPPSSPELRAIKSSRKPPSEKNKKKLHPTRSPYFPSSPHKHRSTFLSALPFPPLHQSTFGLMQETLASNPFRLLLATIFLNKTPGERAMPVFYRLLEKYSTPEKLAGAEVQDITELIRELGFQNQRARKIVGLAKRWVEAEPEKGRRYRKLDYPCKGDGRDVAVAEVLGAEEEETEQEGGIKGRVGWEISHLPGLGPYSHDSWRMFCRDVLLGRAEGWNGEGAKAPLNEEGEEVFEPEWKRVLPQDKELRAWMSWMWLKEGWVWNKETGERTRASEELMRIARGGGVVVEEGGKDILTLHPMSGRELVEREGRRQVGRTIGEILG